MAMVLGFRLEVAGRGDAGMVGLEDWLVGAILVIFFYFDFGCFEPFSKMIWFVRI